MKTGVVSNRGPGRTARVLLTAAMAGTCYVDFFSYRPGGSAAFADLLAGRGNAPQQYRVGVLWLAHWLSVPLSYAMPNILAAIDGACGLIALMVLFRVLEDTDVYRAADVTLRWFGAAAFVLLAVWSLAWLTWIPRPETMPAAMLVALMLWLWQRRGGFMEAAALLALTVVLAFVRADMACLLHAGVFLAALTPVGLRLAARRSLALVTSGVSAVAAGAIQLWLMRVVFPQASYGNVKMWQLWPNLHHASRWMPFVVFLLPLAWMLLQVIRRRYTQDAAGVAFLAGGLLFFALWLTLGKIDEVRIFLPVSLALAPLTVEMAMLRVESHAR